MLHKNADRITEKSSNESNREIAELTEELIGVTIGSSNPNQLEWNIQKSGGRILETISQPHFFSERLVDFGGRYFAHTAQNTKYRKGFVGISVIPLTCMKSAVIETRVEKVQEIDHQSLVESFVEFMEAGIGDIHAISAMRNRIGINQHKDGFRKIVLGIDGLTKQSVISSPTPIDCVVPDPERDHSTGALFFDTKENNGIVCAGRNYETRPDLRITKDKIASSSALIYLMSGTGRMIEKNFYTIMNGN